MMVHSVGAMVVLMTWASIAPVSDTVSHRVKIVPVNGFAGKAGSLYPSSSIGGMVSEVLVSESRYVEKGELLLRFDAREYVLLREGESKKAGNIRKELALKGEQMDLAMRSCEAQKAELLAQKVTLEESHVSLLAEQKIGIARAQSELSRARKEYVRATKLFQSNAISRSELESLRAAHVSANGELSLARLPISRSAIEEFEKRFVSLETSHAEEKHRIETEKLLLASRLQASINEVARLDLKIGQCSVFSPGSGIVSECLIRSGDWISPGQVGIAVSQKGYVAEAILPSRLICNVKKGSSARITIDGVDWLIHGSLIALVSDVAPSLRKEESVLGDGSTEVVDGYRVLLEFQPNDDFEKWDCIRLGMTGTVEIDVGEKKLVCYLLEKAVGDDWLFGK